MMATQHKPTDVKWLHRRNVTHCNVRPDKNLSQFIEPINIVAMPCELQDIRSYEYSTLYKSNSMR
jgi:hypothetical protein